jgi:hypothetical protein
VEIGKNGTAIVAAQLIATPVAPNTTELFHINCSFQEAKDNAPGNSYATRAQELEAAAQKLEEKSRHQEGKDRERTQQQAAALRKNAAEEWRKAAEEAEKGGNPEAAKEMLASVFRNWDDAVSDTPREADKNRMRLAAAAMAKELGEKNVRGAAQLRKRDRDTARKLYEQAEAMFERARSYAQDAGGGTNDTVKASKMAGARDQAEAEAAALDSQKN